MSPLAWQREHQVALLLGIVLGIVAGLLVGFVHDDVHLTTLQLWIGAGPGLGWALLGAFFGASVIYSAAVTHIDRARRLDPAARTPK
jgi:hypothetical protein